MTDFPITSPRGQEILSNMPPYYETIRESRILAQEEGAELDDLFNAVNESLDQQFVSTATWGLDTWEKDLGLTPAQTQPDSERRDRITSRLRGTGTATIIIVKSVAESYDKGSIDVIQDHALYTVTIRFVDTLGIPPNLDDLKAAVRAVLPAHLDVSYEFTYMTYDTLDAANLTWDQTDALGLTWDQWDIHKF